MTAQKTISYLAMSALLLGGAVFAEPYVEPSGSPIGSNVSPVITTGPENAIKSGMFWADSTAADAGTGGGFCFGSDCRTSWPQGSPKSCHLEWKEVQVSSNGNYADWGNLVGLEPVNGLCDFMLTDASKAQGWVATGDDYCMGVSNRYCARPRSCIFTKLACTGVSVTPSATEVLLHPANDPTDDFQTTNKAKPSSGGPLCFFGRCFRNLD